MEILIIGLFCVALIACILTGKSILIALTFGLVLFLGFGRYKGLTWGELFRLSRQGLWNSRNILIAFMLIGMLTASWRVCGTIPAIICYTAGLIHPSIFLLLSFLLCCLVSFLTGTAFGSAATMGVICMSIAGAMGLDSFWMGGAVLAGVFFGDRCSPVSTSAMLVSSVTGTDLYDNIKRMVRSAMVPFLLSCAVYLIAGSRGGADAASGDAVRIFRDAFLIHPVCLLPAIVILVMAVFHMDVKITMAVSVVIAVAIAVMVQHTDMAGLALMLVKGFHPESAELAAILGGGGIVSMVRTACIVGLASCYSGIFQGTGLLDFMKKRIEHMANRTTSFLAITITSLLASALACNQTLAIMLVQQLCDGLGLEKEDFAIIMEDTVVVMAPLIPWSIANSVPLSSVGANSSSTLAACYLFLLPACGLLKSFVMKYRKNR